MNPVCRGGSLMRHPATVSSRSVLTPGGYNNLGLHCYGGDISALNGGRPMGGSVKSDVEDWYNKEIPNQYHSGIESLARAGAKDLGFGLYAGMNGNRGGSLVQDAKDWYNKEIPEQYHSGIESLARAGAKDLGFGLRGSGFFDDKIWENMLDGLTAGGKKLLSLAPEALTAMGAPELAAPIAYLTDKFTVDHSKDANREEKRNERRNPAPAPVPFKANLPAVPSRPRPPLPPLPAVPRTKTFNDMPDSYHRSLGQGLEDMVPSQLRDQFEGHIRDAYNQIPHQLHPAIESLGKAAMNSMGFGIGDYMGHLKNMVQKVSHHIPAEFHPHIERIGRMGMEHTLRHMGMGLNLGIEPIKDSNGERPMSLDWIGKKTGISGINDHMFGGNIMEDFGDASQKWLQGAMRDTPDWLKGPEKDPLAFMYGGEVGDGLGAGMKKPKMVKGSPEAKAFMAAMRAKRGKGKKNKGGELPPRSRSPITDPSLL